MDENGNEVRGRITADVNEDGQYEVYTENPINGRKVNLFTAEELNRLNASSAENSLQNRGNLTENDGNSAENSHQENIATVNQDAINNATVDDLLKADSAYNESFYREHPERVAEELAAPAQATADYINGKLTDKDYLIALGYSTGENSWLNGSATDEDIATEAAEKREKYLPFVTMPQVQQPSSEQPGHNSSRYRQNSPGKAQWNASQKTNRDSRFTNRQTPIRLGMPCLSKPMAMKLQHKRLRTIWSLTKKQP